MLIGLKDSTGTVVLTSTTTWDLNTVQPLSIRALPDWNVPGNPTYIPFGTPVYFQTTVNPVSVPSGSYTVVMKVLNPLEPIINTIYPLFGSWDELPVIHLLFSDQAQGSDGWLNLGTLTVQ